MSDPEVEAAHARVNADIREVQDRAVRVEQWKNDLESAVAEGRSSQGRVRVRVDLSGAVVGLAVADSLASRGGLAVSQAVVQAHNAAQQSMRELTEQLTSRTFGSSESTAAVTAEVGRSNPGAATVAENAPPPRDQSPPGSDGTPRNDDRGGTW